MDRRGRPFCTCLSGLLTDLLSSYLMDMGAIAFNLPIFFERSNRLAYTKYWRECLMLALILVAVVAVSLLPPIPQDPAYHLFADDRMMLGIPNFWNVVSNLAFLLVGIWGIVCYYRGEIPVSGSAYLVFCLGVALISAGSAYYHWNPTPQTLLWDRLPMTVAFMALFSMVMADRIAHALGVRLLWPLVLLGISSVVYWYWTEVQGRGDLRAYVLVQFLPILLIPIMLLIFPKNRMDSHWLWGTLAAYAIAKIAEHFDSAVFTAIGVISGHTLKHLLAAMAVLWVVFSCYAPRARAEPQSKQAS